MNIKQAKQEITNTLKAYLAKDQLGNYLIPTVRQRPVLLMGPPGVGKTQIMEQIAAETGVGLVAYTITHHTRQSAIGLPKHPRHRAPVKMPMPRADRSRSVRYRAKAPTEQNTNSIAATSPNTCPVNAW